MGRNAARIVGILFVFLVALFIGARAGQNFGQVEHLENLAAGSQEKFNYLSKQTSNRCGLLGSEIVRNFADSDRIQGSCCAPMDSHRYQEQVDGLKKLSKIPQVPQDPYNIPVYLAKELLGYKDSIKLTFEQQEVYDEAMNLSQEGGPCCCRCWRWDAFEGLAKFLITEYDFKAEQIAEVWDLEDGCGGEGHEHGRI